MTTETKPRRIQLKRTKGWRMPPNTVKVDRTTKWGNPFVVCKGLGGQKMPDGSTAVETRDDAIRFHREYVNRRPKIVAELRSDLRGKNLACWCKPGDSCHADILLELANGGAK